DRFFKEQEQSPDVDVLPVGVGGGGASAPHDRTPAVEHADDVNVLQVEQALIGVAHGALHAHRTVDRCLVAGRRLVDTPALVDAGHDAAHVPGGRHED